MIPGEVEIVINRATAADIESHLLNCDTRFNPPLSSRVNINDYAVKLAEKAVTFGAYIGGDLVALVAVYINKESGMKAFISNVSVLDELEGTGVASLLMDLCIDHVRDHKIKVLALEVSSLNKRAISFYTRYGFNIEADKNGFLQMKLDL